MTDEVVAGVVDEQQEQAAFDSVDTPEAQPKADVKKETEVPEAKEPETPKFVQLTEEDFNRFNTAFTDIGAVKADIEKRFGTAFGKLGFLENTLKQLQAATPAGQTVDVTDDMVSELADEYPDISPMVLSSLKKFAGKIKGTGPAVVPGQTIEEYRAVAHAASLANLVAKEADDLEDQYPDWRSIIGSPEKAGDAPPNTEYRQWLAKQPEDYQRRLNNTNSAVVISHSISKFNEAKSTDEKAAAEKAVADKAKKSSARQALIRDAVTPRGDGGHQPSQPNTEQAAFEAVFQTG